MVEIMSDEYANLYNTSYDQVYSKLWENINVFQNKIKKSIKGLTKWVFPSSQKLLTELVFCLQDTINKSVLLKKFLH